MRELLDWGSLIQEEMREHTPEHWYMAQIALYLHHILHELRQMWAKEPAAAPVLKVSDLLIGYKGPDEEAETREIEDPAEDESWKEKAKFSKSVWLGFAGLNREGMPVRQAVAALAHVVRPPPRSAPTPDQLPDPEFAAQMAALAAKKQDAEE